MGNAHDDHPARGARRRHRRRPRQQPRERRRRRTLSSSVNPTALLAVAASPFLAPSSLAYASSSRNYCGLNWYDASANCHTPCPDGLDGECDVAAGHKCWADTSCSGVGSSAQSGGVPPAPQPVPPAPSGPTNYCGSSWYDAYSNCPNDRTTCPGGKDGECPAGQDCFSIDSCLNDAQPPSPPPPPTHLANPVSPAPPVDDPTDRYFCGTSPSDASDKCETHCPGGTTMECSVGEACFTDTSCSASAISASQPPDVSDRYFCGASEDDANERCGAHCPNGLASECVVGEGCFVDSTCSASGFDWATYDATGGVGEGGANGGSSVVGPYEHRPEIVDAVESHLLSVQNSINDKVLVYIDPATNQKKPSELYRFEGLLDGLDVMSSEVVAGHFFYMGDATPYGHNYGLVNVAAFLAQSKKETIDYDSCDENNWQAPYPASNACGQLGKSYQDEGCEEEEKHMECPVDLGMTLEAVTTALWNGAPGPLYCGPKSLYPSSSPNDSGRTDVEGCCWWGRGVIQTRGVCNFGKLNYYLGKRAADDGRPSRYPEIDFCADPQAICSDVRELKWIAGLYEWMERVQSYDEAGWNYIDELHKFVDGGMTDMSFIDAVSGIVNRGCHDGSCGAVHAKEDRKQNFVDVLEELELPSTVMMTWTPTKAPTDFPTGAPTKAPTDTPTGVPTEEPTRRPTDAPVTTPTTSSPTAVPSRSPTKPPSKAPTDAPTYNPTGSPVTLAPNKTPTPVPTPLPTPVPTEPPTVPLKANPGGAPPTPPTVTSAQQVEAWIEEFSSAFADLLSSYTPDGVPYPSYLYSYDGFIDSLLSMSTDGVADMTFYMGDNTARGFEYGLANVALFLANAMETVKDDACDEHNFELNGDKYPISNSCGQRSRNYQDYRCMPDEAYMECPVDPFMEVVAVTNGRWARAPGPLYCEPKTTEKPFTGYWDSSIGAEVNDEPYPNTSGRTDVEGCCWWGRGVLQTRGVCNFGKLNYYLGKRAADDGRPSRYPEIDFCQDPEAVCSSNQEMKWVVGLFEWMERVQKYDVGGWNYIDKLHEFVDKGSIDTSFVDSVSAIVDWGCHDDPWCINEADKVDEKRDNFYGIMDAMNLPLTTASPTITPPFPPITSDEIAQAAESYLLDNKAGIEANLFVSQTPQGSWYPSYIYKFDDFVDNLLDMSKNGAGNKYFYLGDNSVSYGHKYGLVNVAAFLAQSMKESINYDACDENNWQLVNDRFPISNSCGQLGKSYQDMHCSDDEAFMECPLDPDMQMVAVTHAEWYGAPAPLYCGPKSVYPFTGYWDFVEGRENTDNPYANMNGRVDVEGCCWWGRGALQTRGVCNMGKLNYYLGKRAAEEGRESRYPNIDFCVNPEAVCGSAESKELKWVAGLFEWMDRVQSYDEGGWNYIDKLHEFADTGFSDMQFIDAVSGIVFAGCHDPPCDGVYVHGRAERQANFVRMLVELGVAGEFPIVPVPAPSSAPTISSQPSAPTVSPTEPPTSYPTEKATTWPPTKSPIVTPEPTAIPKANPSPFITQTIFAVLTELKADITSKIFAYETQQGTLFPSYLYRFDHFVKAVETMSEGVAGKFFYLGGQTDVEFGLKYGLANIAAFLAQSMTEVIRSDSCDENNWEKVFGEYPLSNSCGQDGQSNQDMRCSSEEAFMECPVDPDMTITAATYAKWAGAPGPLFCGPKSVYPFTGYWDSSAGQEVNDQPYANFVGRTDVEGCCWWGRGALLTRGVCNMGKLNYHLGKRAADEGRPSLYPDVDFCSNPDAVCSSSKSNELRWVTGLFEWMDRVQSYNEGGWNYIDKLEEFVDGGMTDTSFINAVSRIVTRGCHDSSCGDVRAESTRSEHFQEALVAFNLRAATTTTFDPTAKPTMKPTPNPTFPPVSTPVPTTSLAANSTNSSNTTNSTQNFPNPPSQNVIQNTNAASSRKSASLYLPLLFVTAVSILYTASSVR